MELKFQVKSAVWMGSQAYADNRRRNLLDSPPETAREIWTQYFDALMAPR
jgi:hypothetical protein